MKQHKRGIVSIFQEIKDKLENRSREQKKK